MGGGDGERPSRQAGDYRREELGLESQGTRTSYRTDLMKPVFRRGKAYHSWRGVPLLGPYSKGDFHVPGLNGRGGDRAKMLRYMVNNPSSLYPKFANIEEAADWLDSQGFALHHGHHPTIKDSENLVQLIPRKLHEYVRHIGGAYGSRRRAPQQ